MPSLPEAQWKPLAKDLIDSGIFSLGVEIWSRSGFRCEYCGAPLLVSPQTYRYAQSDHILPASKYPLLQNDLNNYAHTCGLCNQIKRDWDPAENERPQYAELTSLTPEQRSLLIERTREHLRGMINEVAGEISRIREILQQHGLG